MKVLKCFVCVLLLLAGGTGTYGLTLTFDDVPVGFNGLVSYRTTAGVDFSWVYQAADHSSSTWGPPRSGNNVMVWIYPGGGTNNNIWILTHTQSVPAYSVGGYFSTESGVVLEMRGYQFSHKDPPVVSVTIGASGVAWKNVYAEIIFAQGIGVVELVPVTTDAFSHFCMDDMTINYVPEPGSLVALCAGLIPLAFRRRRR